MRSANANTALPPYRHTALPPYRTGRNSHGVHPITGLLSLVAGCQSMLAANWRASASKSRLSDGRRPRTSKVFPWGETLISKQAQVVLKNFLHGATSSVKQRSLASMASGGKTGLCGGYPAEIQL